MNKVDISIFELTNSFLIAFNRFWKLLMLQKGISFAFIMVSL